MFTRGRTCGQVVPGAVHVVVVVDVDVVGQDGAEDDQRGGHDAEHVGPADLAAAGVEGPRARAVVTSQLRVKTDRQRYHRADQDHSYTTTHTHAQVATVIVASGRIVAATQSQTFVI